MTIPSKQDEKFVNDIYKAVMGESVIEKVQRIEQEKLKAEQEKLKAEQKIQQEKLKAEQEKHFAIRKLLLLKALSDEQIAKTFSMTIEEITQIKDELKN